MKPSPLSLARSFEQLKNRLEEQPAADLRLLWLAEFWPALSEFRDERSALSYFDEYRSFLKNDLDERSLVDLLPHELEPLLNITIELRRYDRDNHQDDDLTTQIEMLAAEAARKYFYVGAVREGLACLARTRGLPMPVDVVSGLATRGRGSRDPTPPSAHDSRRQVTPPTASVPGPDATEGAENPADEDICRAREVEDISELDLLRITREKLIASNSELVPAVSSILRNWEIERISVSFEEARCLFVEKNARGEHTRGRLRSLWGNAIFRRPGAVNHDLTLDNQPKAPDDPFVGCVHNSLDTVARLLGRSGNMHSRARQMPSSAGSPNMPGRPPGLPGKAHRIRARYRVTESDHTFTGDSIGLAAALVAYAQLLRPEIHKHERFVALEAAFTGGVGPDGRLTPVSADGLKKKIERAFFSPVRYLVLPEANLETARGCVDEFRRAYPHRRLHLVGASTLREVIDNLNIVRAERVCMGQFIARKAYKYSRATRIQVPILLALAYLLVCLIYPKAWVGFDWNPQYVRLTERGFEALNADSIRLWSAGYGCPALGPGCRWRIGDLDSDEENEVAFAPMGPDDSPCESDGYLYVYDDNGEGLFRRYCSISDEYPESTWRSTVEIRFAGHRDNPVIVTAMNKSYPAQAHIRFFNAAGDSLGWYINPGMAMAHDGIFSDALETGFIFLGINNALESTSLFVLNPEAAIGVAPPYSHPELDLSGVLHGRQFFYVLFPPTDLNRYYGLLYNAPHAVNVEPDGHIRVEVNEIRTNQLLCVYYYLDGNFRVVNVQVSDTFIEDRDALATAGKLPAVHWQTYTAHLLDAVTYWTDSGWVTEGELRGQ